MLEAFLQSIAWPMTPPQAYGPFHLIFTISGFILCAILMNHLRWEDLTEEKWFYQSPNDKDLIILRQWIEGRK